MSGPIRWGILGASDFARRHMGPAIHAAGGAQLIALATTHPDKAAAFLDFCPELRVLDSYDAMLADPKIDVVYIPLPNHLHVEWSLKALGAGKHVLCEKPMTMQAEEFDQLIARRDETGLVAAEAFMIVHHPQWQRVRQMVRDGAIGKLVHVGGRFSFDNRDAGNIRNQAEAGGGGLRDIGVYVFGAARFVTGAEPEDITARVRWQNGVDVFADVQAEFPGFTYAAYVSTRMHPYQEMLFHGETGVIRLTAPFNARVFGEARIELHQPDLGVRVERFPADNHYVLQVEAFARSVRDGAEYPCSLEFSKGTQAMIDRVFDVARTL
ncbi:Gfo/Idh/MocA family protein [Sedimentitalea todarodis]|uniref:Gfo/Idh/MocA family oxidoreductase n=1 Tax=Sedimentitalea todarodis TaxID=1631240 RepID=A0ABU3V968_9RHOB|nr:Gfo/Idh/MocA family oxidoreductase [Sedimentitalea todarodis]MDU9002705.1 Gfo/Idh/MocA family oxidoreductase [Sedimentitalea todarodis]